ncbi:MAG: hypothetical protein ABI992_02855 [Chthoniobacterales bacterium]
MRAPVRLLLFSGLFLVGCSAAHDVAVTSFRVIDAPAKFVRNRLDPPETTTTTTVQTTTSDVSVPGHPVAPPVASTDRRIRSDRHIASSTPPPRHAATSSPVVSRSKTVTSATPHPKASTTSSFPTAKPVPGKPGYVYSVDPKGGIVDVTGYKSGDKAKDPYTQKIFIVP